MPTKTLYTPIDGTPPQICLADHSADFTTTGPSAANDLQVGTPTDVQCDMTGLVTWAATSGGVGYRQGAEIDFGAHWALEYFARMAVEIQATPTAGNTIELWMGYTDTTSVGEPGGHDGTDKNYAGYSANADAAIVQLDLVSVFVVTTQITTTVQVIDGWTFSPRGRYGLPVVLNKSGADFFTDANEIHIVLNPVVAEFQDA